MHGVKELFNMHNTLNRQQLAVAEIPTVRPIPHHLRADAFRKRTRGTVTAVSHFHDVKGKRIQVIEIAAEPGQTIKKTGKREAARRGY
jgi:hypothetical protein